MRPFTPSPFHLVIWSSGHLVIWSSGHLVILSPVDAPGLLCYNPGRNHEHGEVRQARMRGAKWGKPVEVRRCPATVGRPDGYVPARFQAR
jgi:hypothetical protein